MLEVREKRVIIIAGPNGAGKTTFALEYLPNEADCPVFVNVAVRAGRVMLEETVCTGSRLRF